MKTVRYTTCPCGIKRSFFSEREAEKALGRAKAKRGRLAEARGTGRGIKVESRFYECEESGLFHLTSESRQSYELRNAA
ncbi:hypothetical protein BI024_gp57 [Streptomyces phage Nanodon]|uniref:Uncharacterized protein n=1 Tax=Streptomyces phage Nanodon TaxID=1873777 RepID=A0A1B1PA75_9CAUD|nr:hypothetical protein BI024_gp57 [Streptomyces phage Nanodon]ANT41061.1 hypothetical protein SEA_NANODON_57 [Streptomyces phage Nanodon]